MPDTQPMRQFNGSKLLLWRAFDSEQGLVLPSRDCGRLAEHEELPQVLAKLAEPLIIGRAESALAQSCSRSPRA